jgi:hypothetical protein
MAWRHVPHQGFFFHPQLRDHVLPMLSTFGFAARVIALEIFQAGLRQRLLAAERGLMIFFRGLQLRFKMAFVLLALEFVLLKLRLEQRHLRFPRAGLADLVVQAALQFA